MTRSDSAEFKRLRTGWIFLRTSSSDTLSWRRRRRRRKNELLTRSFKVLEELCEAKSSIYLDWFWSFLRPAETAWSLQCVALGARPKRLVSAFPLWQAPFEPLFPSLLNIFSFLVEAISLGKLRPTNLLSPLQRLLVQFSGLHRLLSSLGLVLELPFLNGLTIHSIINIQILIPVQLSIA